MLSNLQSSASLCIVLDVLQIPQMWCITLELALSNTVAQTQISITLLSCSKAEGFHWITIKVQGRQYHLLVLPAFYCQN